MHKYSECIKLHSQISPDQRNPVHISQNEKQTNQAEELNKQTYRL